MKNNDHNAPGLIELDEEALLAVTGGHGHKHKRKHHHHSDSGLDPNGCSKTEGCG